MRKTDTAVTAEELKARDAVIIARALAGETPTAIAAAVGVVVHFETRPPAVDLDES